VHVSFGKQRILDTQFAMYLSDPSTSPPLRIADAIRGFRVSERRPPLLRLDDDAIAAGVGNLVRTCRLGLCLADGVHDAELAAFLAAEVIRTPGL
jgi:hypothetical protein